MDPLPDGYIDTGITQTLVSSCTVQWGSAPQYKVGTTGVPFTTIQVGNWVIYWFTEGFTFPLEIRAAAGDDDILIEAVSSDSDTYDASGSPNGAPIELSWEHGPLRLGVKRVLIEADPDKPYFAQGYKYVYGWFADEDTERIGRINGTAHAEPQEIGPGDPPTLTQPEGLGFAYSNPLGIAPPLADEVRAIVTDFSVPGGSDLTGLTDVDGNLHLDANGTDGALVTSPLTPLNTAGVSFFVNPSYHLLYDIDLLKETGGASAGAEVITHNVGTVVCPYAETRIFRQVSWEAPTFGGYERLTVDGDWAAAQPVPWDPLGLRVMIFGIPPRFDPGVAAPAYLVSLNVEAFREIKPLTLINILAGTDPATYSLAATYGAPGTELPEWRPWLTPGHPSFNADLESKTRSSGVPWDWASYSYLVFKLVSIAATTLTFAVHGVRVAVSDNHETGSSREDAFEATETPFTATYLIPIRQSADAGDAQAYKIDLMFPHSATVDGVAVDLAAGAPFYLGRIDGWTLDGFNAVGLWVFTEFGLRSLAAPDNVVDPGLVTFKHAVGAPVQRGDYDAGQLAHNGAAGHINLTDRTNCTEHIGHDGRGVRAFSILTGAVSGEILDEQYTLMEYAEWLGNVEAWDVEYDEDAAEAALSDGTNSLNPLAQDLAPQLPGIQFTAGAGVSLPAWVMCGELHPVPGIPFIIHTRDILGHGALEAQTHSGRRRGPAGRTVTLTNGQSAATDAHGYVQWGGVGANGLVEVGVGSSLVLLRAHDKRRLEVALPALGRLWPFNLTSHRLSTFYNRAHVAEERVQVALRRDAGPVRPFLSEVEASTGSDARPVLCWDQREHLHLFYGRESAGTYARTSWRDGQDFLPEELMIPGGIYPFVREDPGTGRILLAALVGSQVVGRLRDPDRTWSVSFVFSVEGGAPLAFDEEDTFAFDFRQDGQQRLIGAFHLAGEDEISEWWSSSFGRDWVRVTE